MRTPWRRPAIRRPTGAALWSMLLALALLLTGCLFEQTPRATPTAPVPTATPASLPAPSGPLPTPALRTPDSRTPPATRPRSGGTASPPVTSVPPGLQDAGRLLYLGTLNGEPGIIMVDADGSDRRMVAPGFYDLPAWSPDGRRFAAFGITGVGFEVNQIAIFSTEGRATARFPLQGIRTLPPLWSPDSRRLLIVLQPGPLGGSPSPLLFDENGLRALSLPADANVWRWTPDNRVAFGTITDGPQGPERSLWTVDPEIYGLRKEFSGAFLPLGWSPDGAILFLLAIEPAGNLSVRPYQPVTLVQLDVITGGRRTITTVDRLVEQLLPGVPVTTAWFSNASIASRTGNVALRILVKHPPSPARATDEEALVVILDPLGQILAWERLASPCRAFAFSWSADGQHLAYACDDVSDGNLLYLLNLWNLPPTSYPLNPAWLPPASLVTWSPDGRWVAFVSPTGILIGSSTGPYTFLIAPEGKNPAWQPQQR